MTAATVSSALSPAVQRRTKIGPSSLVWLVWRQHRLFVTTASLGVLIMSGLLWWDSTDLSDAIAYVWLANMIVPATAGVFAVFLGASLLSAEYERGTHLLVWAQDVSPTRWLTAKLAFLGAWIIALLAILGAADTSFIQQINHGQVRTDQYGPIGMVGFESWIPLQIGYALFGVALGLAIGALLRRTVVSMVVTLVVFTVVRLAIGLWRPDFLTPLRYRAAPTPEYVSLPGANMLPIDYGTTVDATGKPVDFPSACVNYQDGTVNVPCARSHGAVATYVDYQPASRLPVLHGIELVSYLVLTVVCVVVAYRSVRRHRQI